MTTLYQRWQEVARAHGDEFALRDAAANRQWTFHELAAEAASGRNPPGPAAFPQGGGPEFILTVLRAWQAGQVVCPLEPGQPAPAFPRPEPPIVHLKTTSATTGHPRLVAFTAEQLAADTDNLVATMGLRPDWPNLGVISLAHSYGFSNLVTPLLLCGIPLILGASPLPEAVRLAAQGERALTLPAVPALWRLWEKAGTIPTNVRLAISAGALLPVPLERAVFESGGLKIHNFYGSSECGGIAYDRSDTPRTEESLAGTPVENVSLARAEDGCLEVRGRNVALSYWPEGGAALGQGKFHTTDLADLQDGRVHLLGRATEVIHVAGRKVAPETVERELLRHPWVREALVLGMPMPDDRGESVAAVVVADGPVDAAALRHFLEERLPAWQVPRRWRFAQEPLADGRGKVSRSKWREVLRAEAAR